MTGHALLAGRLVATLATGLILLAATGCDTSRSGDDVASASGSARTSAGAKAPPGGDALKFAQCMRDNGVPDFRDPGSEGGALVPPGTDPKAVEAAQQKCKQYLPDGGQPPNVSAEDLERSRRFAQCMRDNGVPDFPDPQADGGGQQLQGVDTSSGSFKSAQEKCDTLVPRPSGTGPAAGR
jgi:hypothetical protein